MSQALIEVAEPGLENLDWREAQNLQSHQNKNKNKTKPKPSGIKVNNMLHE